MSGEAGKSVKVLTDVTEKFREFYSHTTKVHSPSLALIANAILVCINQSDIKDNKRIPWKEQHEFNNTFTSFVLSRFSGKDIENMLLIPSRRLKYTRENPDIVDELMNGRKEVNKAWTQLKTIDWGKVDDIKSCTKYLSDIGL